MRSKGQGTIEYLVIIAIVVVIALVVVGLLLQLMNQGSGIPETTSRTAWKSSAPWAIVDWSRSGATLTVVLKNNSYESLDFERLTVGASDYNNTKTSDIASGATLTKTIDISGGSSCTQGTRYSIPQNAIYVDFNTTTISGRRQTATADIIGTC